MDAPANSPEKRRFADTILIVIFAMLIWLPTIDTFFHTDKTKPTEEKRVLAEFPHYQSGALQKYLGGLEAYFNDHFGYRQRLIRWHNRWKWDFFRDRSTRDVIIGTDGWLYITENKMVEHYRGVRQFTPEELHDWQTLLEKHRDWLAERGIKYVFTVAPDKHSVYPQYLPSWLVKANPETKLDQFIAHMHAHSTVEVLDLRPPLIAANKIAPTYYKTDTHWNTFGAFVTYSEVAKSLAKILPGFEPVSIDSFDRITNHLAPGGDLAGSLGLAMTESNAVDFKPKPSMPPLGMPADPPGRRTMFLTTTNLQGTGKAVLIHDSFGRTWAPFLGYNFQNVACYWQGNFDTNQIIAEKPVVVVQEMIERFFNVVNPKDLLVVEKFK